MASRSFYPLEGTLTPGLVILSGEFTTTTSGTIGTSDTEGFTVTKTGSEVGRYTVQLGRSSSLVDKYPKIRGVLTTVIGPDDAAMTDAKGLTCVVRDDDVASDGTFEVQFCDQDSGADAELQDGAKVLLVFFLKNRTFG